MNEVNNQNQSLHVYLALIKGVKEKANKVTTEVYHTFQKPDLFTGFTKKFRKTLEEEPDRPNEDKLVRHNVLNNLDLIKKPLTDLLDIAATRDFGNCVAKADVTLNDGTVILTGAPATYLIWLEKQLVDLRTNVRKIPTLELGEDWKLDEHNNLLYISALTEVASTKKVTEQIIVVPATDKFPAQTAPNTRDIHVGYWVTTKMSGAIPSNTQKAYLDRIDLLLNAVMTARQIANSTPIVKIDAGKKILDYILG